MDWQGLTLFLYILARMSGCVLFNPIMSRNNIPGIFRAGLVLLLTVFTSSITNVVVSVPSGLMELAMRILLELFVGFVLGMIMNFFFSIAQMAGQVIDTQMGMSMNQIYDSTSQSNVTVTGVLLNTMMLLLFFAANGHHTLLRIFITSGVAVPFGGVGFEINTLVNAMLQLFVECAIFAVKLAMPILVAELIGEVGMGLLMKVIPQINVFVINIDLKIIIGLVLLLLLVSPISEYLLEIESYMLNGLSEVLGLMAA